MKSQFAIVLMCFSLCLAYQAGCAPPRSTAPTIAKSSGTTEEVALEIVDNESSAESKAVKAASAVELAIVNLDELKERIQGLSGKVVVVDLWSTSCIPCMREFPNLVALGAKYPETVACLSFNLDYIGIQSKPPESYLPKVQEFLQKTVAETQKSAVTNLLSATPDGDVLTEFSAESIPAILIFGSDGQLAHKLTDANSGEDGLTYEGDVIPQVEALLGESGS